MMSLPDDWKFFASHLKTISKDGREAIDSAIKELMQQGYVTRERAVIKNNKGVFAGYDYTIHETK